MIVPVFLTGIFLQKPDYTKKSLEKMLEKSLFLRLCRKSGIYFRNIDTLPKTTYNSNR